jgi:hypothetical protein
MRFRERCLRGVLRRWSWLWRSRRRVTSGLDATSEGDIWTSNGPCNFVLVGGESRY